MDVAIWLLWGYFVGYGGHRLGVWMEGRAEEIESAGMARSGFLLRLLAYIAAAACIGQALGALAN